MKILKFLRLMTFGVIALFTMAACSDDDDNGGDSSSGSGAAAKGVIDFDGERLYAINDCNVEYDAQGRVARITQDDNELEINYAKGTIIIHDETEEATIATIKFNNDGYITEIVASWDEIYDTPSFDGGSISYPEEREKGTSTATYTYSNGFLTKISIFTNETCTTTLVSEGPNGGRTEVTEVTKYQISETHTLYWNLGNLVQITNSGWETADGGNKETWGETYSINYGTQVNKYRQFPVTIVEEALYFDDPLYMMAAVGLFGKGPTTLPRSMAGNDDYGTWNTNIIFNVNSKEAISKEFNDDETYTYYYSAPKDNNGNNGNNEDEDDEDDEDANVGEAPNPPMHSQLAPNAKSAARTLGLRKMFAKPTHRHHK